MARETVRTYQIGDQSVDVELNWEGKEPENDCNRFYDIFDSHTGECLNEGEPWYDDGDGVPSKEDVASLLEGSA